VGEGRRPDRHRRGVLVVHVLDSSLSAACALLTCERVPCAKWKNRVQNWTIAAAKKASKIKAIFVSP
jgi:hypothetical protein